MNRLMGLGFALLICCAGQVFAQSASTGSAQTYPTKPIRLIVPFPAGESIDALARMISQQWQTALGQQIVIDTQFRLDWHRQRTSSDRRDVQDGRGH